jgi:toxin ParE1/3/4
MTAAVLSNRGRRDLLQAVRWIQQANPAAARALRDAVAMAVGRIGDHPDIGVSRPTLARVLHGAPDLSEALEDL